MSSETDVKLADLVKEWLRIDRNPETKQEISDLWTAGHTEELKKRLTSRIQFGTAGLRGRMEAGWSRMNDLIVIQASQGLCAYVLERVDNAKDRGAVIGYDHRHHSERWARLTAAAFLDKGVKTYLYRDLVHTPMQDSLTRCRVPFGVKRLNAACGIMITASHNPKYDNGYKVYWENGVQIISPHDSGISGSIEANLNPERWEADSVFADPLCIDRTHEMVESYLDHIASLSQYRDFNASTDIKFVNTSMHGVGHTFVDRSFGRFGFHPFTPVKEQQQPDPEFTTVNFPNPEEAGMFLWGKDLAMRTADTTGATYVLAQDPDADRFSAAERRVDGTWVIFTGDQLGTLFAGRILDQYKISGNHWVDRVAMVASTVSSKMIGAMAAAEGFKFTECLTGFKFIGNMALALVEQGYEVPFGYEEAIGFMIGSEIRDKDGVAAAVFFAELVTSLHREGKTASNYLQELYGYFQTNNSYFICDDPLVIDQIFARLRNYDGQGSSAKPSYPKCIAGLDVTGVVDLTLGYDSTNPPTYKPNLPLSSGHMIQFRASSKDGSKIVLTTRTSGTEPKIKYYLEGSGQNHGTVENVLKEVARELSDEWVQANLNKLGRP
ncbi:hypothetical protein B0F90DRAFT_1625617 [Multifurca ochricompacta]|uniref:Phosphoglucomutase n=1 Tax=Multifurca ochricompacta TaxID=376703 RepID=A0AAD4QQA4_9AGAM|nr:hypothetical protein B0F90DRAFT_1625617 [Multifurca ochricompacta]